MRRASALFALAAAWLGTAPPAEAQAYQCRMPQRLAALPPPPRSRADRPRIAPITGYTLALSWSPEFCKRRTAQPSHALQCSRDHGEFGFVLHGLWPEAKTAAYPQYCARRPVAVPVSVVRKTLCDMPSQRLIAHQWDKHGSCMAADPASYFQTATGLYRAIKLPDMERLSRRALTHGMLRRDIARLNPGMMTDSIVIKANARGWLEEVRLCLTKAFRPRTCPARVRQPRGDTPLNVWRGL